MKNLIDYITGQRWAVFVSVVSGVLVNLPALIQLVQIEINKAGDKFNWFSLIPVIAGFVIQRNVWSQRSVEKLKSE